ncbi:MAG: hypothetical protein J7L82_00855 [Staphylothermus sp.]|nr:hypothetical protein [Staphylothermus sp.]
MSIRDEIVKLLKEHDLEVKKRKNVIRGTHKTIPVTLIIRLVDDEAIIELEPEEELRDVLVDLVESGEDIEDVVDDVLSELRDIAVEISQLLSDKGYDVKLKLREGENDVRDILEELEEEYSGYEEE